MRKILAMVFKELVQIRRDRRSLLLIFVMPVLQLLILGFASNLDVRQLALAVLDQDKSCLSRQLINNFKATEYFSLAAELTALDQLDPLIKSGQIKIALIIPPGFERNSYRSLMSQDFAPTVQLIFDGSESYTANIGIQYASLVVANFNHKVGLRLYGISSSTLAPAGGLEPRSRVWFNPDLNSRRFLIPGIMAMLLMLVTILLTALAIVREKELGTLEQLLVTPLKPYELILGKLLPFFVIGLLELSILTFETWLVFGINLKGSLLSYYFLSIFFILPTLGIGFLVSTFSANQQQAMLAAIFFFILPMILLSGFVFPINNMPKPIQIITYAFPLRFYFVIIRGLFLKGVGLAELADELLALSLITLVVFSLAIRRFRRQID